MMKLFKQRTKESIDFNTLDESNVFLNQILHLSLEDSNIDHQHQINNLLEFQSEDGSFRLIETFEVPSDIRVDYCYRPTYLASSILMKYLINNPQTKFINQILESLSKSLLLSTKRNLDGHGYEAVDGQLEALDIFYKGDVILFLETYPNICVPFSKLLTNILKEYKIRIQQGGTILGFGRDYKEDFLETLRKYQLSTKYVFVYGTLKKGNSNHELLHKSKFIGNGVLKKFEMHQNDNYPWIIPGNGYILGEVYEVNQSTLRKLDYLESEGILYQRKLVKIKLVNDQCIYAYTYILIQDENKDKEKVPMQVYNWNVVNNYVWYFAYGSNICKERFLTYITGEANDQFNISATTPMQNLDYPLDDMPFTLDKPMYFANSSSRWQNLGVSFLDMFGEGLTYGRMYLITKDQLKELHRKEGCSDDWYSTIYELGHIGNIPIQTISNPKKLPYNKPHQDYLKVIEKGLLQTHLFTGDEIAQYLESCNKR